MYLFVMFSVFKYFFYFHSDYFKSISCFKPEHSQAVIQWQDNWIKFIDAMFQVTAFKSQHEGVTNIRFIDSLVIDVNLHGREGKNINREIFYDLDFSNDLKSTTRFEEYFNKF